MLWPRKEYRKSLLLVLLICKYFDKSKNVSDNIRFDSTIFFDQIKTKNGILLISYFFVIDFIIYFSSHQSNITSKYIESSSVSDKMWLYPTIFLIRSKPRMEFCSEHDFISLMSLFIFIISITQNQKINQINSGKQ